MTRSTRPFLLFLTAVAAASVTAIGAGFFRRPPGEPSTEIALWLVGSVVLFALLVAVVPAFRRSVRSLDPLLLTSLQAWRILGMMFLFLMFLGELSAAFAVPAGVGDVLVGVGALWATDRMRRGLLSRRAFGWFIALGLADFVLAFTAGNLVNLRPELYGGFASMTAWPLVLVPGLFVPLFSILHLAAWWSFAAEDRPAAASGRAPQEATAG